MGAEHSAQVHNGSYRQESDGYYRQELEGYYRRSGEEMDQMMYQSSNSYDPYVTPNGQYLGVTSLEGLLV